MSGAYFQGTGEVLCLIRHCGWRYKIDPEQGLDARESVRLADTIIRVHREDVHPNHQLQVQKCPLRGCGWEERAWSLPGGEYDADRVRLQKKWSKHMNDTHPTVRGPGTIQVTAALFPYGVPSSDNRVIANGAVIWMPEDGVPIVNGRGELVGRAAEATIQDGWMYVEGFLREDLISELDRTSLWGGDTIPVHFAIREAETTTEDDKLVTTKGTLTGVHMSDHDITVWEGTGMKALHPEEEPHTEGETRSVAPSGIDETAMKTAQQGVNAVLLPLQHMLEEWGRLLAPAVQALAEALAEHAEAVARKPEPMVIKVAEVDADFLIERDPPVSRYTCTCGGMPVPHVPGGPNCLQRPPQGEWVMDPTSEPLDLGGAPATGRPGVEADHWLEGDDEVSTPLQDTSVTEDEAGLRVEGRLPDWREYVGQLPVPEGPEDWTRLPRDGKRAPTGCEVCEAPVDGRHPRDCPGA